MQLKTEAHLWSFSRNKKTFITLREKCPDREFFLVRIFLYSVQIQENRNQKKTPYSDSFHAVLGKFKGKKLGGIFNSLH